MGLGRGSKPGEPQPRIFREGRDNLPVFDEADDPQPSSPRFAGLRPEGP
jgi:hypothetical protein